MPQDIGVSVDDQSASKKIGDVNLRFVRDNINVQHVFNADGSTNWDHYESLMVHGLQNCMRVDPTEYPLFMANNDYGNYLNSCESMLETCFEKLSSPAVYIGTGAMLSSFSQGKPTSLVVDIGARGTRIVPIVDGYTLNRGVITNSRGGDWMDRGIRKELDNIGVAIKPWYEVGEKKYEKSTSETFREMHVKDVVRDVKKWMSFVPYKTVEETYRTSFMAGLTIPPYELPDGTLVNNSEALCTVAEKLFAANPESSKRRKLMQSPPSQHHSAPQSRALDVDPEADSFQELVHSSVARCDVDARRDLLGNIIVVGGGSLVDGVPNRLQYELTEILPSNMKVKVSIPLPVERHYSAWIGGSILSICGSFQQLWITKSEYLEYGSVALAQHRLRY
jgi:actin-related protein